MTSATPSRVAIVGDRLASVLRRLVQPWVALGIRVWLAQAFVALQIGMIMGGHTLDGGLHAPLGAGWWSALAMDVAQSGAGTAVQALCPLLLAAGLFTRPAALAMLIEAILLPLLPETSVLRPFWVALLAWTVVFGPGAFSLDHLFGRGVHRSALPGAALLATFYVWLSRIVGPIVLLVLRVWLAAAPLSLSVPAMVSARRLLPHVPGMIGQLPGPLLPILAGALALGLGVRPIALLLLALVPVGQVMSLWDDRLYWLLSLAILVAGGGGALSLDRLLARLLGRASAAPDLAGLPHVVIVGGGFGGVAAAQGLRHAPCRVTLIDQRNFNLFQPLLYQVATASLSPADIAVPIRAMFRDQRNLQVLLGCVTGADTAQRIVRMREGQVSYDYLVLATGAQHGYFGRDDWASIAPGLKTIEDATTIRHRLLEAFEEAENCDDPAERAAWLTFLVVGGGPTGVEMAGAMAELSRHGLAGEFRRIDPAQARVILVQAAPKLLPAFPEHLSDDAAARLTALGVEVQLDRKLEALEEGRAIVSGETIFARTVLWAAGVMASDAAKWVGAKADRAGRVVAGPDLGVAGAPGVFAIGDTAASDAWDGKPVPGLAPAAKQAGAYVAKVIQAALAGRPAPAPFRYRHFGSLATIGRQAAVADFGRIRLTGAVAWWLWGVAHIAFLAGGRNRVTVIVEWFWAYVTFRRGTRLITGAR